MSLKGSTVDSNFLVTIISFPCRWIAFATGRRVFWRSGCRVLWQSSLNLFKSFPLLKHKKTTTQTSDCLSLHSNVLLSQGETPNYHRR